jgi:autotransporter-associated beta strand protein
MQSTANSGAFMNGLQTANVRNGGAIFEALHTVTMAQPLLHSTIGGDNAIDGGLTKMGAGNLTLSARTPTYGGTFLNAGTLTVSAEANLGDAAGALNFNGGLLGIGGTTMTSTTRTINWGLAGGGFDINNAANISR